MRVKTIAAVISLACIVGSTKLSRKPVDLRLHDVDGTDELETDVTACAKSLLNRQSLINTSSSITKIIMDRLDIGPNQTEPAGLELTNRQGYC